MFCPSGMQQYKKIFSDLSVKNKTICNIQNCIRLNDIDLIGDGTHLGLFKMIGLFSFRELTLEEGINFWMEFVTQVLKIKLTHVTIHPDKSEWSKYYPNIEVKLDKDCLWSDGNIGGYCTEFYVGDLEVGNIVNPLGDCLDVGFGLERLDTVVNGFNPKSRLELLEELILTIIDSGVKPSHNKQGYVLRKLIRTFLKEGGYFEHEYVISEQIRQQKMSDRYNLLKNKHPNETKEWWFSTHGIEISS